GARGAERDTPAAGRAGRHSDLSGPGTHPHRHFPARERALGACPLAGVGRRLHMYLGLDIGTSSVKAVLMDEEQRIVASATSELDVSRPHPGWSEQDPDSWWTACEATLDKL